MLNNNNSYIAYNNFKQVPTFPYRIIEYLIENSNEDLFKLLKYQTIDALDKDNLTSDEKLALIWNGIDTQEQNYKIFLKPLIANELGDATSQCQIRLFRYDTTPVNRLQAIMIYELDIITHEKCGNVYYNGMLCERTDLIENLLIDALNGTDIGGTQMMMFDRELSRTCKSLLSINNSKSFYGRSLYIGQQLISPDTGGECG